MQSVLPRELFHGDLVYHDEDRTHTAFTFVLKYLFPDSYLLARSYVESSNHGRTRTVSLKSEVSSGTAARLNLQ